MKLLRFFIVMVLAAAVAGCGYTYKSMLPDKLDSIHVQNFVNKINPDKDVSSRRPTYSYWPGLETDVTRAVIDGFIFDRHLYIKSKKDAAMLLVGELVDFRQLPLSYDKGDSVVEYRVEVFVDLKLYDQLSGELMWTENRFMGWSSYNVSGPNAVSEGVGVKNAVKDLAQRVVERVVEAW